MPQTTVSSFIHKRREWYTRQQLAVTAVPAPTGSEGKRAAYMLKRFRSFGLTGVRTDKAGNVIGRIKGKKRSGALVLCAHLDTVFPQTDLNVHQKGAMLYGPGISDNGCGLLALLAVADFYKAKGLKPERDIVLLADVCEEGTGDLRGVKSFFTDNGASAACREFIAIDGADSATVTNRGLGSVRYRMTVAGPGGHSYQAFGTVNPVYILTDIINGFKAYRPRKEGQVTLSVGTVAGGTSVNTIPEEVTAAFDMRGTGTTALRRLEKHLFRCIDKAVQVNRKTYGQTFNVILEKIGDRPVGKTPVSVPLVASLKAVWRRHGIRPVFNCSSTDSNIPMSLGVPAVTIGIGGTAYGIHTLQEYYDTGGREAGLCVLAELVMERSGTPVC